MVIISRDGILGHMPLSIAELTLIRPRTSSIGPLQRACESCGKLRKSKHRNNCNQMHQPIVAGNKLQRTANKNAATIRRICERFNQPNIQSFQLTLSVQSMKLKDKTESLRGIFMNKFIKISHAWRKQ